MDIIKHKGLPRPESTATAASPADDVNAIFRRLRALRHAAGENTDKNDVVDILIHACIDEGIDSGKRIVGALRQLGFDKDHVGLRLRLGIVSRWTSAEGHYRNLA